MENEQELMFFFLLFLMNIFNLCCYLVMNGFGNGVIRLLILVWMSD